MGVTAAVWKSIIMDKWQISETKLILKPAELFAHNKINSLAISQQEQHLEFKWSPLSAFYCSCQGKI